MFSFDWANGAVAPFVASPDAAIHEIFVRVGLTREDVVLDLGCGDGRLLIEAAVTRGARGVGIDLDQELLQAGRERAEAMGVSQLVELGAADLMDPLWSWGAASVVVLYLLPATLERLGPRLEAHLLSQRGSVAASVRWPVKGLEKYLEREPARESPGGTAVHVYTCSRALGPRRTSPPS
mmetsp:Transcript_53380/g.169699  ORF Transcript_53380/g.169699 Transcript_53380/m.169699 type:complete len:180 (+) Transcript_53380:49-588(+)